MAGRIQVPRVRVELYHPISQAVSKKSTGQTCLTPEIQPGESPRSLLARLVAKYRGLREIFDTESGELSPAVWADLNEVILNSDELLDTKLKDGDILRLFPVYLGG